MTGRIIHCGDSGLKLQVNETTSDHLAGTEVDFVIEATAGLVAIEIKLSATPRLTMATAIKTFQRDMKSVAMHGYVVHPGDIHLPLSPDVTALPFADL